MRSFAIWYDSDITDAIDIKASVHVNFGARYHIKTIKIYTFLILVSWYLTFLN